VITEVFWTAQVVFSGFYVQFKYILKFYVDHIFVITEVFLDCDSDFSGFYVLFKYILKFLVRLYLL
jgi:hypothetical protein